jgi:hypothetical protein
VDFRNERSCWIKCRDELKKLMQTRNTCKSMKTFHLLSKVEEPQPKKPERRNAELASINVYRELDLWNKGAEQKQYIVCQAAHKADQEYLSTQPLLRHATDRFSIRWSRGDDLNRPLPEHFCLTYISLSCLDKR